MTRTRLLLGLALLAAACTRGPDCPACDTLVIAATGEPASLIPPLVRDAVGRDVSDLIFERLAYLEPGGSPADPGAYRPGLAGRWSPAGPGAWRFVLRPGAAWHDGQPVTPADVVFSFGAYTDPALGPAAPALAGRALAEAEGDTAVVVRFAAASPEDLYDATWHVRVLPRHVWAGQPPATWAADTSRARILGSGPFRLSAWDPGQSLRLERVRPAPGGRSGIRVVVWRFAGDQEAAVNLLLAGQADLIETVTSPSARAAAARDSMLLEVPYPSAVYGFVGLRHADASGAPHPVLSSRGVRRALTLAVDRQTLVRTVVGADAAVPPGPVSRALWIWDDSVSRLPFDPGAAAGLLDSLGWTPGPDGVRRRAGSRLAVDILVPGTSPVRRNLAQGIQEMWRRIGVAARVTAVDFPVFQERLAAGRFDAMIGAWLDEPSPRGMAEQWTREGWGGLNAGRYHHPGFDSLVSAAAAVADPGRARRLWREALDTLNADAAGIFLYTPTNVALAARRLAPVPIDPFSWLSGLPGLR